MKIDKSFVVGLPGEDTSIVRTTIELGHNMGLKVIAEGVENAASLEMLKNFGCDMAQGYFMCPPLPPAELLRWNRESIWGRKSDVVLDQARDLLSARDIPGLAVATEEQAKTAPNDAESATSTARPTAAP